MRCSASEALVSTGILSAVEPPTTMIIRHIVNSTKMTTKEHLILAIPPGSLSSYAFQSKSSAIRSVDTSLLNTLFPTKLLIALDDFTDLVYLSMLCLKPTLPGNAPPMLCLRWSQSAALGCTLGTDEGPELWHTSPITQHIRRSDSSPLSMPPI